MSGKILYNQPKPEEVVAEEQRRIEAEQAARSVSDGRKAWRKRRPIPVGFKTTEAKRQQLNRLRTLTEWDYTEILEKGVDLFEDWWKQQKGNPRT